MSNETTAEQAAEHRKNYLDAMRKLFEEFLPVRSAADDTAQAAAQAEAEARTDARVKSQLAANEERFVKELAFRERMVTEQLRAEAATAILAALIQAHAVINADRQATATLPDKYAADAVALADALCAELKK